MELGHHGDRDGGGPASPLRYASHAGPLPYSQVGGLSLLLVLLLDVGVIVVSFNCDDFCIFVEDIE